MSEPSRSEARIIAEIETAIEGRQPARAGSEIRFLCPVHDDHDPSARWNPKKRTWFCDACGIGGGYLDLAQRLGIAVPERSGLTLVELAAAKRLSEAFLRSLGVTDGTIGIARTPCVDIPYLNLEGDVVAVRKRLRLSGDNRFVWRRGDHPAPYGLAVLKEAREEKNFVLIVEGESDQWVCRKAGVPAVGIPGASVMKQEWGSHFGGIANVFVWHEPDTGGVTFVEKAADAVPNVRVITAPPDAKDPAELWLRCNGDVDTFIARMSELAHSAPSASSIKADTSRQQGREAYAVAASLLADLELIERVGQAIRAGGYAGDTTPPMIAYLALTSRLLDRPLNLAFVAPSSAGKNRAVDAALALMPASAYFLEKAGSARALVYGDESYEHRTIVVSEADSIPDDGAAASAIRSIASDNVMTYDTVEKGTNGQMAVRRITKPGPTGLITTSTKPLSSQFDTRTLTVPIADTPGQTRDVMRAHAAAVGGVQREPDVTEFIALQTWLDVAGRKKVTIPFAALLAETVPADHVRMRRDFRQLLTMVEAIALLHQRQRDTDGDGRIVATLDDYGRARTLLLDVFQIAVSGGVTAPVRETVHAVNRIYRGDPLTKQEIADELKLSKDTAWHRIRRAISLGYLSNDETRKGRPAQIRPGDRLPDDRPALPRVQDLMVRVSGHPETDSTVQPSAVAEAWPESEARVEGAVESAIQPPLQPSLAAVSASAGYSSAGQVERLNAEPEAAHTGIPDPNEEWEDIRV